MKNERFYRILFLLAGGYNILWGLFSVWQPQWLFRYAQMPEMEHPQIFACLGMVVGLYGLIYLEVARRPRDGYVLIAVGLLGKILGPFGWIGLYLNKTWPAETIILILTNDLIWWFPFFLYLKQTYPTFKKTL